MIEYKSFTESISFMGRRKLSRKMKLAQPKLKQQRKRAKRRTAPEQKILDRAVKRARNQVAANFLKGRSKSSLSHAAKSRLEKQVKAKAPLVKQKAKRAAPQVRKDDRRK